LILVVVIGVCSVDNCTSIVTAVPALVVSTAAVVVGINFGIVNTAVDPAPPGFSSDDMGMLLIFDGKTLVRTRRCGFLEYAAVTEEE